MTRQFSITFGLSESGPMISSVTVKGPNADINKTTDLRVQPQEIEEPINIEGQIRAESILSSIKITSLGQERTGDLLSLNDAYFSSLWAGQDRDHNVSLCFCFDMEKYARNKIVFPVFASVGANQIRHLGISYNDLYDVSMKMFKQEIKKNKKTITRYARPAFEKNLKNKSVFATFSTANGMREILQNLDFAERIAGRRSRLNIAPGKISPTLAGPSILYTALDIREET